MRDDNLMRNELIKKLKQLDVVYKNHVNLKNAGPSDIYIDIKKAYGYPNALNLIAYSLWNKIDKRATCIATAGYGGISPASVISATCKLNLILVRDELKEYGKVGLLDGYAPNKKDKIAIIDDVFTTGKSLRKMIKALKPTGANILGCYVVCKRGKGKLQVPLTHLLTLDDLL